LGETPNAPFVAPNVAFVAPNVAFVAPNVAFVAPNAAFVAPNAAFVAPNAAFVAPNVAFVAPNVAFVAPKILFGGLQEIMTIFPNFTEIYWFWNTFCLENMRFIKKIFEYCKRQNCFHTILRRTFFCYPSQKIDNYQLFNDIRREGKNKKQRTLSERYRYFLAV
jgi:hypothetical protein